MRGPRRGWARIQLWAALRQWRGSHVASEEQRLVSLQSMDVPPQRLQRGLPEGGESRTQSRRRGVLSINSGRGGETRKPLWGK
ncbi:MAG TPA: hypothetical protein VFF59_09450 [Anaerolineae bacterium]|nr:hypothetical protein [Anaerolineae bacterium]